MRVLRADLHGSYVSCMVLMCTGPLHGADVSWAAGDVRRQLLPEPHPGRLSIGGRCHYSHPHPLPRPRPRPRPHPQCELEDVRSSSSARSLPALRGRAAERVVTENVTVSLNAGFASVRELMIVMVEILSARLFPTVCVSTTLQTRAAIVGVYCEVEFLSQWPKVVASSRRRT
eukprot:510695-Rhodomonas_salina.1